ncbi:MAG: hypothetical protein LBB47_02365 [Spirochaetaceae bacterium]|jgi:hypothetical protein|nr:hypothetical protein [Spirochaetaceae bacterium]
MANTRNYIPNGDGPFLEFAKNLYAYALINFDRWSVPSPQAGFEALLTAYEAKFEAARNPNRGKVDTLNKNESRAALEKAVRGYCKAYLLYNPKVTGEDRERMGLPVYSHTRHSVSAPHTSPRLFIDTGTRRRLIITYKDEGSAHWGKPSGVHGIEVRWAILDNPPIDLKELINSAFDPNPRLTLEFEEHERGEKDVHVRPLRNPAGREESPRRGIEEAIIP